LMTADRGFVGQPCDPTTHGSGDNKISGDAAC
jgi:hypothetical protein